ncbi:hypothetical protein CPB84DRAFT_1846186 [Gymnopilus junonius]|uniref:MICOS complex subunit MIC10 n=1 Tax=Gymnopilus junonius TaxID=109634 RepID=A0A9P5NRW7_GYMJU|nr:hypothetical protein CPB84DRAFT_1846186 [Gymnopilus junonius]
MSATPAQKPVHSEDVVGHKFDRCLADLLVKAGVGFGAGVVASVILFRRRTWPIALSTGFGAGAAYADCDRSFNPPESPASASSLKHRPKLRASLHHTTSRTQQINAVSLGIPIWGIILHRAKGHPYSVAFVYRARERLDR